MTKFTASLIAVVFVLLSLASPADARRHIHRDPSIVVTPNPAHVTSGPNTMTVEVLPEILCGNSEWLGIHVTVFQDSVEIGSAWYLLVSADCTYNAFAGATPSAPGEYSVSYVLFSNAPDYVLDPASTYTATYNVVERDGPFWDHDIVLATTTVPLTQ